VDGVSDIWRFNCRIGDSYSLKLNDARERAFHCVLASSSRLPSSGVGVPATGEEAAVRDPTFSRRRVAGTFSYGSVDPRLRRWHLDRPLAERES